MALKIILFVRFFAVMIGIDLYSKRHAKDVDGFILGGSSVGAWLTAFAFGTSYFSAVIFVGYAGWFGWRFGLAYTRIGIRIALLGFFLAWVVLGRRTRIMTQHLDSKTMTDCFGLSYKSPAMRTIASIFAMILGLIIVPLISLITPKMKKDDVDQMFSCYDKDSVVNVTKALCK